MMMKNGNYNRKGVCKVCPADLFDMIVELNSYQKIIGEYQELESYIYSELEVYEHIYTHEEIEVRENQIKKYRETIESTKQQRNELLGEIWCMIDYLPYPVWFELLRQIRVNMDMAITTGAAKATQAMSPEETASLMDQMLDDDREKLSQCEADIFSFIIHANHEI